MMIALALALAASTGPLDLHLACTGRGVQSKPDTATLYQTDNNGNSRTSTVIGGDNAVSFEDQVRIDLSGDGGRIRLPQAMLPPIHGGQDGWFPLREVRASSDEILAVATINLFNKIKLRLDRLTGGVSFTVMKGQFNGACRAYDPAATQRAF